MQKLQFLKGNLLSILVWPALCLVLGGLLWGATMVRLSIDRQEARDNALKGVASLSGAYAQYLTRTIEQMDQIAMQVQYDWNRSGGLLDLKDFRRQGLLIAPQLITVTILGMDGFPLTSTVNLKARPSALNREYFIFHRENDTLAARVGQPLIWPGTGTAILPFTRRLNAADGSFAGVVAVSIGSGYFSEFYDDVSLGSEGLLAMVDLEGTVRTARTGDTIHTPATPVLSHSMTFGSTEGSMRMEGSPGFVDGHARIVGWRKLQGYPFMAVVGISEAESLAGYYTTEAAYRNYALGGSLALLFFGIVASAMATRLAWRKQQMDAVQATYRVATEGANEGFYMLRPIHADGRLKDLEIVDCNVRGAAFYGKERSELLGMRFSQLNTASRLQTVLAISAAAMASGFYEDEVEVAPGGSLRIGWIHRRLVRSGENLAVTVRDISENKLHEQQLRRLARQDVLTGLPNRQWLTDALPIGLERAREQGGMLALLFIDLDKFKHVNDSAGHQVGDELLRVVARRMQSVLRPGDHVVRLGGDEFTVLMEPVLSEQDATHAAERIAAVVAEPFALSGGHYSISASIGISVYPRDGGDAEKLLNNADIAMYAAKDEGRGGHFVFQPELYHRLRQRIDIEQALGLAIDNDEFELHFQPRVRTADGALTGLEALLRWNHPERGLLSPGEFIPLIESAGLLQALGEMVVNKACAQIAQWQRRGLPLAPVAVNVSGRQFNQGSVFEQVAAALERHLVNARWIEVEITDVAALADNDGVNAQLQSLSAMGIRLHIDDFGVGPSSLAQLQQLPVQVLKIHPRFTFSLGADPAGAAFFNALISMAHALKLVVVAEGVESLQQLDLLKELDCDEVQGYFVAPVLPAAQLAALLETRALYENVQV
ncbi:MAG: EAL domain-containing protein [Noviherbaspirillum sp.]